MPGGASSSAIGASSSATGAAGAAGSGKTVSPSGAIGSAGVAALGAVTLAVGTLVTALGAALGAATLLLRGADMADLLNVAVGRADRAVRDGVCVPGGLSVGQRARRRVNDPALARIPTALDQVRSLTRARTRQGETGHPAPLGGARELFRRTRLSITCCDAVHTERDQHER